MQNWILENRKVLDKLKEEFPGTDLTDDEFVFRAVVPTFRGADIQFGYLCDSIFIDFGRVATGQLYLMRMSFDGYGCCECNDYRLLSSELSTVLDSQWQQSTCDMSKIWPAMKAVVALNKDQLWKKALLEYGLDKEN